MKVRIVPKAGVIQHLTHFRCTYVSVITQQVPAFISSIRG